MNPSQLDNNGASIPTRLIGTLQETSLHAALKAWYARPGDQLEASVDGFVVDILRGELIIEIQTRHFTALKTKLSHLIERHPVHLIHPIPREKWIVRMKADRQTRVSCRKSPKHGRLEDVFYELIRIPQLVAHPNFSLEVIFIHEEEVWLDDRRGSWRRAGWSILDRRLLRVLESVVITTPDDFLELLPQPLGQSFTARRLAQTAGLRLSLAQKMVYSLRAMGIIEMAGKNGREYLYRAKP